MIIQTVSAPAVGRGQRIGLRLAEEIGAKSVTIIVNEASPITAAEAPPKPAADKKTGEIIGPLLKSTTIPAVAGTGYLLVSQLNNVTPTQLAGELTKFNLVADPALAQSQADNWLAMVQSKGGNAILLGGVAGATTMAIVETVRPEWPQWVKWVVSVAVAGAVAALLYFGVEEGEKPKAPATPVPAESGVAPKS
jgi:hypothetical protein